MNNDDVPSGLIKYSEACRAIAAAYSVDEVKDICDEAAALQAYAWQAKNRDLEINAAEIRIRAERRVGEMMAKQKETVGLATGGQPYQKSTGFFENPVDAPSTLAEAGIDKNLANRARKLAKLSESEFKDNLTNWRDEQRGASMKIKAKLDKSADVKASTEPLRPRARPSTKELNDDQKAEIINLWNLGHNILEITREVINSAATERSRRVESIIDKETARREGYAKAKEESPIDVATLSLTAQEKLDLAIRQQKKLLDVEFERRITERVRRDLEDTILPHYKERYEHYDKVIKARRGIMDHATYRKIWSCLHPDRVQDLELKERYEDAFRLFSQLETVLLNEKELPTPSMAMPTTYDELMKLKKKTSEARAERLHSRTFMEVRQ